MLKRLPPRRARELVTAASDSPTSNPEVTYPRWYLHRWHFLPEGYLSRRSAAGYDNIVRHAYNQGLERRTISRVISELKALVPSSVLEVGCGPGRLLAAIAQTRVATDLVGLDLSPYLLERARKRLPTRAGRLVHADALSLPAEEASFDVVVASHYVGHLPPMLRSAAVREMARVVRPGGHIVVVEHRWHAWPETKELLQKVVRSPAPGLVQVRTYERAWT